MVLMVGGMESFAYWPQTSNSFLIYCDLSNELNNRLEIKNLHKLMCCGTLEVVYQTSRQLIYVSLK